MSDLRFQKLTPTSNVDLNAYEEGFEFIFHLHNGYWAMGIVVFIGMLLFVLNYGKYCTWINEMNSTVWNYEWLKKSMFFLASPFGWVLSVLCITVIACLGLYHLLNIQTNKNIFKKISVLD